MLKLTLSVGRYWKGIESIISSHVMNEGGMFTDPNVKEDSQFNAMLERSYGNRSELAPAREQLKKFFPPVSASNSPYKTQKDRYAQYVSEMSFTCHNRILADAYPDRVYSVQYAVPPATHGSDQAGTFFNPLNSQFANMSKAEAQGRQAFQSYLVSFALTGSPNKARDQANTIDWPLTAGLKEPTLSNVLNVDSLSGKSGLSLINNDQFQVRDRCHFWTDLQKTVDKILDL
jgi:carboxylesterase type B